MSQNIYIGYNKRAKPDENVYPNYSSAHAAFLDIINNASLYQKGPYDAPLHWRQDDTVEFVVDSAYNGTETYCCWVIDNVTTTDELKKYGFGIIVGSEYVGVKDDKKLFKYLARRDYLMEYLPSISFSQCKLTRYTVPESLDTWGAFPQDEPVSCKSVIRRTEYLFPFSDYYSAVMGGGATFYPVVTLVAFPESISSSQANWGNPSPLDIDHSQTVGRYSTAAMTYVVCKEGLSIDETNAWDGFSCLLDNIEYAGVQLDQYIANVSLVPADLIDIGTSKSLKAGLPSGALGLTVYHCKPQSVTQEINLLDNTDTSNNKSQYYGGSIAVFSGGKKYIDISKSETDGSLTVWSSFNGIPCMKARMGFIGGEFDPGDPFNNTQNPSDGRAATIPFPSIPVSSDTFQAWWRQNRVTQEANDINKIIGATGAAANTALAIGQTIGGNPQALVGAGLGIMNYMGSSYLADRRFEAAISSAEASSVYVGSLAGSDIDSYGSLLSVVVYGLPKSRFSDVTNLFRRYGYSVGGMTIVPKKNNGNYWTFIQGQVSFKSDYPRNIPTERQYNYILQAFSQGVTFWDTEKMSDFGNFNKENHPANN